MATTTQKRRQAKPKKAKPVKKTKSRGDLDVWLDRLAMGILLIFIEIIINEFF